MNVRLNLFLVFFIGTKVFLVFSNNENIIFSYLSNSLGSLAIQQLLISGGQGVEIPDDSDIYDKVKKAMSIPNVSAGSSEIIKLAHINSIPVTKSLVEEGTAWIKSYFMNDKNFDFLKPLTSEEMDLTTRLASSQLNEFLKEKRVHVLSNNALNEKINNLLNPSNNRLNQDLQKLSDYKSKFKDSEIYKKNSDVFDKFFRLLRLVETKNELYGLKAVSYPKTIIGSNLNETLDNFQKYQFPELNILEDNLKAYHQLKNSMEPSEDNFNAIYRSFEQLEFIASIFDKSFSGESNKFKELINLALQKANNPRLTGSLVDFNKQLTGLDLGQQEQIKRRMDSFALSEAVKYYLFSGSPLLDICRAWQRLYKDLQQIKDELNLKVSLEDTEKLTQEFMNQVYDYAIADSSLYSELYYSRVLIPLLVEASKIQSGTSKELIKDPILEAKYKKILEEIKKFRKSFLLRFYKAEYMIKHNPYNEKFKKALSDLSIDSLPKADELFIKLVASQLFLKFLTETTVQKCIDAIGSNQLFKTVRRKFRREPNKLQHLDDFMIDMIGQRKKYALGLWNFENTASHFETKAARILSQTKTDTSGQDLSDFLKKSILNLRPVIEEDEDEEEEEYEEAS